MAGVGHACWNVGHSLARACRGHFNSRKLGFPISQSLVRICNTVTDIYEYDCSMVASFRESMLSIAKLLLFSRFGPGEALYPSYPSPASRITNSLTATPTSRRNRIPPSVSLLGSSLRHPNHHPHPQEQEDQSNRVALSWNIWMVVQCCQDCFECSGRKRTPLSKSKHPTSTHITPIDLFRRMQIPQFPPILGLTLHETLQRVAFPMQPLVSSLVGSGSECQRGNDGQWASRSEIILKYHRARLAKIRTFPKIIPHKHK